MISPAEVAKLAHHEGVGDRAIEKDYVLSWLLVAISESDLRPRLVFKGGTALKRCYFVDYRYSEDLDFSLSEVLLHHDLVTAFEGLFPSLAQRLNLTLSLRSAEQSAFDSTTLLVDYVGPLRARLGSRNLKVDVTRGELLLYPPSERPLDAPYSDYPRQATLPTYTLPEIMAEKLCALMGRTEPRDLYDVYWLFEWGYVDWSFLPAGFAAKAQHKRLEPSRLDESLARKTGAFERLWAPRLSLQVPELPHLTEVLRAVRRHLRSLDLI